MHEWLCTCKSCAHVHAWLIHTQTGGQATVQAQKGLVGKADPVPAAASQASDEAFTACAAWPITASAAPAAVFRPSATTLMERSAKEKSAAALLLTLPSTWGVQGDGRRDSMVVAFVVVRGACMRWSENAGMHREAVGGGAWQEAAHSKTTGAC